MQGLTEGPRAGMDPEIVRSILTGDDVEVSAGLELVDSQGMVLEDLSDDLLDGEVSRDNYAMVHGSASLSLSRRLVWGRDRVRPFMTLSKSLLVEEPVETVVRRAAVAQQTSDDLESFDRGTYASTVFDETLEALRLSGDGAGGYATSGTWDAEGLLLREVSSISSSSVTWVETAPGGTSVTVETSFDGGATWVPVTNGGPVPDLTVGSDPSALTLLTRVTLAGDGTDTPSVSSLVVRVEQEREVQEETREVLRDYEARFNLGVFVLTTPETVRGEDPVTYDVEGFDLLHLLQDGPGDTYTLEPPTGENEARGCAVEVSGPNPGTVITDGDTTSANYFDGLTGSDSVTVDLGRVISLDRVVVWHYFADGRTYLDTKTEVSTDGLTWTTVFDSAVEGTYAETSSGHTITFDPAPVRYIRDSSSGNTANAGNHWVEIQAFRDSPLTYVEAVRQILADSGVGAPVRLDGTLQETPLVAPMVWALHEEPVSWLRMVNDLLAEINYRGLWVDQSGTFRSGPYLDPAVRAEEWTFDTSDSSADLLGEDRKVVEDLFDTPNHWRFVRKGMATEPVEGDGVYTVKNEASGPASIMELGRTRRKVVLLDAADQASLVAQGDRIVAEDQGVSRVFEVEVDSLPIAGHFDVVRLADDGLSEKCQVRAWTLPLDGSRGRWEMEAV